MVTLHNPPPKVRKLGESGDKPTQENRGKTEKLVLCAQAFL